MSDAGENRFYAKLKLAIASIQPKIISVDCFDTILFRGTETSNARMMGAALRAQKHFQSQGLQISASQIFSSRCVAMRATSQLGRALQDQDDVQITRVFETTLAALGFDPPQNVPLVKTMIEAELAEEQARLSLNRAAATLLRTERARGARIVMTSDTSLNAEGLRDLLGMFKVDTLFDQIRASGDYGLAKYSGRLFKIMLEEEGVKAGEILHFGDDRNGDLVQPSRLGIHAIHVPRSFFFRANHKINHVFGRRYALLRGIS